MSQLVTFTMYDSSGVPLAGLTPIFTKYMGKAGGDRTPPVISASGNGKYRFTATDSDVLNGTAWVADGGLTAFPRYADGGVFASSNPFETLLFLDATNNLFTGIGAPAFTSYADSAGTARVAPALLQLANNYLYTFAPSTDDLAVSVGWIVQGPNGSVPAYYDDTVTGQPAVGLVNLFGITPETLRNRYFSQSDRFSSVSNPSETTVTEIIAEAAGRLEGLLNRKQLSGITIVNSTSSAWLWCRRVVRLMAAIEVADESSQTLLSKGWNDQLIDLLKNLTENGYLALGDGVSPPSSDDRGPTTHIDALGLNVGDTKLASDAQPIFRQSDSL